MTSYKVKAGDSLTKIAKRNKLSLGQLLSFNPRYKSNPNQLAVGDVLQLKALQVDEPAAPAAGCKAPSEKKSVEKVSTNKKKVAKKTEAVAKETDEENNFIMPYGQLTFDAEGMEKPGRYFSRVPHVPGASSGVTIGRGYDMKERSKEEILDDLRSAGVAAGKAKKLSQCSGYFGKNAKTFLVEKGLENVTITPAQQKVLFLLVYKELEGDVLRICNKADVLAKYGDTDWDALNPLIRDTIVDLRYRGDYTGATRQRVQPTVVSNDLKKFRKVMLDQDYWIGVRGVPKDRFKRRANYLSA